MIGSLSPQSKQEVLAALQERLAIYQAVLITDPQGTSSWGANVKERIARLEKAIREIEDIR